MRSVDSVFRKHVWMVNTLLRATEGISLKQLDRRWMASEFSDGEHLSRTSFNRYREDIQEMFGVNIQCRRKAKDYYYFIDDPDALRSNSPQTWMLHSLSVGNALQNSHTLQHRILLEQMPGGQEYLQTVIDAMQHGHTLHMHYHAFGKDETTLTLAPYCLKVFHLRWYVAGKSSRHHDDTLRVYALDRVTMLTETDTPFTMPVGFDAETYFADEFGVMCGSNKPVETIVIRAYGTLANYLRTLPLHASQREVDTQHGWADFQFRLRPTYDFRQELLSQADQIEILSPESFKEEFVKVLRAAARRNTTPKKKEK